MWKYIPYQGRMLYLRGVLPDTVRSSPLVPAVLHTYVYCISKGVGGWCCQTRLGAHLLYLLYYIFLRGGGGVIKEDGIKAGQQILFTHGVGGTVGTEKPVFGLDLGVNKPPRYWKNGMGTAQCTPASRGQCQCYWGKLFLQPSSPYCQRRTYNNFMIMRTNISLQIADKTKQKIVFF